MSAFIQSLILCTVFAFVYSRTICYDGFGCFNDSYPLSGSLSRPISFLPQKPAEIGVRFTLYNRQLGAAGVDVTTANMKVLKSNLKLILSINAAAACSSKCSAKVEFFGIIYRVSCCNQEKNVRSLKTKIYLQHEFYLIFLIDACNHKPLIFFCVLKPALA